MSENLPNDLTGKQRAFVETYLSNGYNATDAARQAGYAGDDRTLAVAGAKLVRNGKVRAAIDARLEAETLRTSEILKIENDIARFDPTEYIIGYGKQAAYDVEKLIADGFGHLIRGIRQTQHGPVIELADPDQARDRLLKAYGAYQQTVNHTGSVDIVINWDDADNND